MNVITAVVQFDGDKQTSKLHTRWYVPPTRGGFWCQLDGQGIGRPFSLVTDDTWAAHRAEAWDSEAPFMNDVYFQEIYAFGKAPLNWHSSEFDDNAWPRAVVLGSAGGTGTNGEELPWRELCPRDIPPLKRERHLPVHVHLGEVVEHLHASDIGLQMTLEPVQPLAKASIEGEAALLNPDVGACILHGSDPYEAADTFDGVHDATLILDFGHLRNAHLVLEVECQPGASLDIGYGPDLLDGRVSPYRSPRTSWADRIILADGLQRWRSFFWRQFRFVQITLRYITLRYALGPVCLHRVEAESTNHTWDTTTTFSCSDPQLETFWQTASGLPRFA